MEMERYKDFSLAFHDRVSANRIPVNGTIEVTRRCPLTCAHCYNNLAMDDSGARSSELTLDEHRRILDEITEAGCLWLLFTGGEIFARRDFLDIYAHAKRNGLLITLFTNGTLVTPRIADYLAEWMPFSVEITLYGRTRETYERLTGIPGSYDMCLRGIHLLKERGVPLKLKTVAVTINKHEIFDMVRFSKEELGLECKFDSMINPRIDCSQSPLAIRLKPEEIVEFDLQDAERIDAWKSFASKYTRPVQSVETAGELYHCGGGVNSFAIDPQGLLSICVLSQVDKFDLRQGGFREGWEHFLYKVRRQKKISTMTKCVDCQIKAMCGMCPANGELENGDPESPVDFLCQVAHMRAQAIGMRVPEHGACEYCEGGSGYAELKEAFDAMHRRSKMNPDVTKRYLPVASQSAGTGCGGGCASCGPK
ncbi:MAG: hypothetical protein DMF61_13145 [Blastocatellia bacterium AA13]|nr:MAG: hypothetical protein DMF61_13145 [Blastocatellia bacterium AA13]